MDDDTCRDSSTGKPERVVQRMHVAAKRLIDIVASACALLVLAPLLLGVAVAIKLTSNGPVLFRQTRVGLHGSTFNLFFPVLHAASPRLSEAS